MDSFEDMLEAERGSIERFVRFRLNTRADADDCLQEIYLAAYKNFGERCPKIYHVSGRRLFFGQLGLWRGQLRK